MHSTRENDISEHDFNDVDEELDEEEASVEDEDYLDYEYTDTKAWVDATTQWFSLASYNFDSTNIPSVGNSAVFSTSQKVFTSFLNETIFLGWLRWADMKVNRRTTVKWWWVVSKLGLAQVLFSRFFFEMIVFEVPTIIAATVVPIKWMPFEKNSFFLTE